jgi:hypothetical protein
LESVPASSASPARRATPSRGIFNGVFSCTPQAASKACHIAHLNVHGDRTRADSASPAWPERSRSECQRRAGTRQQHQRAKEGGHQPANPSHSALLLFVASLCGRPPMPRVDFGVLTLPRNGLSCLGFGFHGDLQNMNEHEHEDPSILLCNHGSRACRGHEPSCWRDCSLVR